MSSILSGLIDKLISIPGIIVALSFHEYAHALVAEKCGDSTPRNMGRVTLNPVAHFDIIGLISLLLVGFGWGKPVVIDPRNFKRRRLDSILVGLAGVVTNFITAILFALLLRLLIQFVPGIFSTAVGDTVYDVLLSVIVINISLMLFNLLPIPPLDGFGVLCEIFNIKNEKFKWYAHRYGMVILILMVALDVPELILNTPFSIVYKLVIRIAFIGY